MSEVSPALGLPYIQGAQAQKHVTHNEAIRVLDVAVQLAVFRRDLTAPLPDPEVGDRYIVAVGATGLWAGQARRVAIFAATGWEFFAPLPGWRAHVLEEERDVVFDGLDWIGPEASEAQFARLGVATAPDATNRLAVSSPASLFTHAGNDHRMVLNRAGASDTASLVFQSGFSGRAEMGLAGSESFEIKTSPDGSSFATGLRVDAATGRVRTPQGVDLPAGAAGTPALAFATDAASGLFQPAAASVALAANGTERLRATSAGVTVTGLLSGTAVTQSTTDTTTGRITRVGDYGLGSPAGTRIDVSTNVDNARPTGFYRVTAAATNAFRGAAHAMLELPSAATTERRQLALLEGANPELGFRSGTTSGWSDWAKVWHDRNTLGTVALSGGIPTGALIERGQNANGDFARWADGTLLCWHLLDEDLPISTAFLGGFRSAAVTWTFPSAFTAAPSVQAMPRGLSAQSAATDTVTATTAGLVVTAVSSQGAAPRLVAVMAVGHWG
jgi:hypothetical protein